MNVLPFIILLFYKCGWSYPFRLCHCRNLRHVDQIAGLKFAFLNKIKSTNNNVVDDSPRGNLLNFMSDCKLWFRDFPGIVISFVKKEENINTLVDHVKKGFSAGFKSLMSSFQEGERGYRGEDLVFFEFIVGSLVLFGIPNIIKSAITILSVFLYFLGASILLSSTWQMRNHLSLFLIPPSTERRLDYDNASLTTMHDESVYNGIIRSGPYAFIRHPMYYGISLMCLGSSLISHNVYKLLSSIILIFVFDKSASQEEIHLRRLYPDAYSDYAKNKYKLFAPLY